eukprot:2060246-Alexandrium_andersonii.AAC.2
MSRSATPFAPDRPGVVVVREMDRSAKALRSPPTPSVIVAMRSRSLALGPNVSFQHTVCQDRR